MLARARSIRPIGQLWCFGLNIRYGINNHISETMANVLAEILMANVWNLKTNLKIWNESMREGEVRVLLNTLNSSFDAVLVLIASDMYLCIRLLFTGLDTSIYN